MKQCINYKGTLLLVKTLVSQLNKKKMSAAMESKVP